MISESDSQAYRREGYLRVKGVFSPGEVQQFRQKIESLRTRAISEGIVMPVPRHPKVVLIIGDVLGMPEFKENRYVVFDDRIVDIAKRLLGDRLVYFGDSSIQTGEGLRGYHKDNIDRSNSDGLDWKGEYRLAQFGVYLQDHSKHGGGLKLRAGSHQHVSLREGPAMNIPSEIGDVLVWSSRITHSGNAVRLRAFPSLVLPPLLERFTPGFLRVPEEQERMVIFLTFGAPGPHVDRYIEHEAGREDCRDYWKRACVNSEIRSLAEGHGIELRQPIPEYGSLNPHHQA
ncbi:MAG TPA: phytanoyl-CoA dioxygenase family protein [Planctomycetota bacterium]|nr:phytanoyl-CoA dioxygenase family protein [Planctomycetota bacterium]